MYDDFKFSYYYTKMYIGVYIEKALKHSFMSCTTIRILNLHYECLKIFAFDIFGLKCCLCNTSLDMWRSGLREGGRLQYTPSTLGWVKIGTGTITTHILSDFAKNSFEKVSS